MSERKLNVAIVGLGFGAEFIPIYQRHPQANMYAICQRTREKLDQIGDHFGIEKRYTSFEDLIEDSEVDAVHINTPIHLHAPQSIAALEAGKHVACTVPAATTIEECERIVAAARKAKKNYMMMETRPSIAANSSTCASCATAAGWAESSSCAVPTCKTWKAGRPTGRACRRCITPPIASARAWQL